MEEKDQIVINFFNEMIADLENEINNFPHFTHADIDFVYGQLEREEIFKHLYKEIKTRFIRAKYLKDSLEFLVKTIKDTNPEGANKDIRKLYQMFNEGFGTNGGEKFNK